MLRAAPTSPMCIMGIAGAALVALLIDLLLRQQLPFQDLYGFLVEAFVLTIALPSLLCLTQQHCCSSAQSGSIKKCCAEEDDLFPNFIAEANICPSSPIDALVRDASAEPEACCEPPAAQVKNNRETEIVREADVLAKESEDNVARALLIHALGASIQTQQVEKNLASVDPVACLQENKTSKEPNTLQANIQTQQVEKNLSSVEVVATPQENQTSEEPDEIQQPEECIFQVDPVAVRTMHVGPSHLLLQAFREAATANGVEENYKRAAQGPSQLLTQALQVTAMANKMGHVEDSPKSTTASSDEGEEMMDGLEIDQAFDCNNHDDESAEWRDDNADEYESLLRDLGVPSERAEDSEDGEYLEGFEDPEAVSDYRALLEELGVPSDKFEADEGDEDDEEWEVTDDAADQTQEEDDEYRAFLEEMGVPADWSNQIDDEEEEWLTEDEEEEKII